MNFRRFQSSVALISMLPFAIVPGNGASDSRATVAEDSNNWATRLLTLQTIRRTTPIPRVARHQPRHQGLAVWAEEFDRAEAF
jgi:hypothetical protein